MIHFASIHTICTRWIGPRSTHARTLCDSITSRRIPSTNLAITPKPCTSGQFFSWLDAAVAPAESKKPRHPRPHPRHKSGTPPVVSPTRTPAISVTHVYRSSAGITNGGPSRAHAIAAPDPAEAVSASGGGGDATPQCRGDGQRPKHFCSCATPVVPRTFSALA